MDPTGIQNRLSGGKRRKDAFCGEEEVVHDNQKMSRRWMSGRGDESDSNDHLSQVNQALELRGMSVDQWMRLQQQQQQQQKIEPAAPTTPMNLQQPLNVQQRTTATSLQELRAMDSSKQAILPCPSSQQQQLATPQTSHSQLTQQSGLSQLAQQQQQQTPHQQLHQHQHHMIQQQPQRPKQPQHMSSQQQGLTGGQVHKFQEQVVSLPQQQHHLQVPSYLDVSSCSRPSSNLSALPLSFRPPPVFAEADLRHSPTSSSSNQYPLQNVMTHHHHQQQQRLPLQGNSLLPDCDEDRFSSMLSGQSSVLQQQQSSTGMSGTSNSLVLQDLQASGGWYSPLRELDSQQQQPHSGSRLGRTNLLNGQNVNLYSSASLSDLTSQSGLAPLPGQSCPSGSSFRDSPVDQDQFLGGGDPQSPIPYGMSGSSSSSVVGPKSSCSPLPRPNCSSNNGKQPIYQADFPRGVGGMMNGPYCASTSGPDLLNQAAMMTGGAGVVMPDDNFVALQRAPPMPKPMRSYTKVYKVGAIGRALDVTRFHSYTELRCELARMFNLDGQLDPAAGWQLVFLDNENDILLVGDDPWEEFVTSVRGIRILSPSEVYYYMNENRTGTPFNTL